MMSIFVIQLKGHYLSFVGGKFEMSDNIVEKMCQVTI